MGGMVTGSGNSRAPLADRKDDLYQTPPVAVDALVRAYSWIPRHVWEPACGPGNIAEGLRQAGHRVTATDLVEYHDPRQDLSQVDFLMESRAPDGVEGIVTNPPFKLAGEFVEHALRLVPVTIMLLRLAFLESERRSPILDNGELEAVYVFRKRLPMMHRDGWEGRKASSGMAFAWFVWNRNHTGPATLHRISWESGSCQSKTP